MGQRLVVTIQKDGENIANAYYHWSAYTDSALEITNNICDRYDEFKEIASSDLELAVMLLQSTGAGLNEAEWRNIANADFTETNHIALNPCANRNEGLLCITAEGMKDNLDWSDGDVYIDIGDGNVNFEVINYYELEEFMVEYGEELEDGFYGNIKTVQEHPLDNATIHNFREVVDFVNEHDGGVICGDEVYLWIE